VPRRPHKRAATSTPPKSWHNTPDDGRIVVLIFSNTEQRPNISVRRIRSRKHDYYQLVRHYRNEECKPRTEVLVHLGEYETPEEALSAWPEEIAEHWRYGRDEQAEKLEAKLETLRRLTKGETIR